MLTHQKKKDNNLLLTFLDADPTAQYPLPLFPSRSLEKIMINCTSNNYLVFSIFSPFTGKQA